MCQEDPHGSVCSIAVVSCYELVYRTTWANPLWLLWHKDRRAGNETLNQIQITVIPSPSALVLMHTRRANGQMRLPNSSVVVGPNASGPSGFYFEEQNHMKTAGSRIPNKKVVLSRTDLHRAWPGRARAVTALAHCWMTTQPGKC